MIRAIQERQYGVALSRSWFAKDDQRRSYSLDLSHLKTVESVHRHSVLNMEIDTSDERFLLSGDLAGQVCIYDLQKTMAIGEKVDFKPIVRIKKSNHVQAPRGGVTAVAWNPVDTGLFMTGSYDKKACVWDTNELVMVHAFRFDSPINVVKISALHPQSLVAIGSDDVEVSLCDLRLGGTTQILAGHTDAITALSWSPLSEYALVSGSADGSMRLWDLRKSGSMVTFDYMKTTRAPKKRAAPNVLNSAEEYDEEDAPVKQEEKGLDHSSARSPVAKRTSFGSPTTQNARPSRWLPEEAREFGPSRNVAPKAATNRKVNPSTLTRPETAHQGRITDIAFLPCGSRILSTGLDGMMRLWDANRGLNTMLHYPDIRNNLRHPARIALSHDGRLVYHPRKEEITVLEVETGRKVHSLQGHYSTVSALAFHPALPELYTASTEGQMLVWTPYHEESRFMESTVKENAVLAWRRNALAADADEVEEVADWDDDDDII